MPRPHRQDIRRAQEAGIRNKNGVHSVQVHWVVTYVNAGANLICRPGPLPGPSERTNGQYADGWHGSFPLTQKPVRPE
jgi:hypothetical protein